ncbi:glucosyl-3-phosphoglycerate synthase [Actinophytocola xinjiangensis]|uniref:Glucosyl-3-phosphoglycerate synthase n=1 Tax=Actinophytocola xinjiangensis TaxID=485602 RepID=A0A7Z0WI29_9PSEU|nr:glucosyl-3-phosphoglycerate synthase [Actinophytocola xinjiangensis]OLF07178.1 glucosyl-3-phosphoglycerate synthase [Actinophytocola xinjiangensis]
MDAAARAWFASRTWQSAGWTVAELVAAKGSRTVSVVLPALNEQATVAGVIASIAPLVPTLVDELVVVDSGSTDATVEVALAAGARVVHRTDVLSDLEPLPGKGEVLWRSLAATSGDLLVFVDSDLVDPDPMFVPTLLGPLLLEPDIQLVKGFYRRPLSTEDSGGGRVTELMARPLLSVLRPELAGVIQPLAGEYAGTRRLLEAVPFASGYGVEIGLLLDAHERVGLPGLAQVNLGVRRHRNQPLAALGVMARQILSTALARCGLPAAPGALTQFVQVADEWLPDTAAVPTADRPPMRQLRPSPSLPRPR